MSSEPELIMSPLCQSLTIDGHTVQVEIYRLESTDWSLEVVDAQGTSVVWDNQFETDQLAFDEFSRTIREEGIGAVAGGEAAAP